MAVTSKMFIIISIILPIFFYDTCEGIKCFSCNSANNSACLDMHLAKMHAIVPVVDCQQAVPNAISKDFFCRKITQTILHADQTPEVRITRSCGWIKHKKECYKADNSDHLETVCQCFGDMCNAASALKDIKSQFIIAVITVVTFLRSWREKV